MKKAALHNLGCKVNEYELEAMAADLKEHGFQIVPFDVGADLYVINTCTVTNIADRKSRQMLHKAKKMNPDAVVAATGCYVDVRKADLVKDPAIDIVLTNEEKRNIGSVAETFFKENAMTEPQSEGSTDSSIELTEDGGYEHTHTRAFIKIQDGCNQFCSYCIIPFARGPVRTRPEEEILEEIKKTAHRGCLEVVLTGIHISSYGTDQENGGKRIAWRPKEGLPPLYDIIKKIHETEGIERIRLGSLEPRIMNEEFTKALSELPKICPQFHLSLQSGCDDTLRRMNRHYTTDEFAEICERIRRYFPDAAITTDIITGFPGETDEEFDITKQFVKKIGFAKTHIFRYSRREGTIAASRDDQVPENIKAQRSDVLIVMNKEAEKHYAERFLEKTLYVLLEEPRMTEGKMLWMGHTKEYIEARVEGEQGLASGIIVPCRIKAIRDGYVLCEVCR